MAEVKWIKITTDIFNDEKILLIEGMPDADAVIVIWFKLLSLAGRSNSHGVLMMNDKIAYTEDMLSMIFRRPASTVRMALQVFEQFGMIDIIDGVITIPNWEKHQNIDKMDEIREYNRIAKQKSRAKQKALGNVNDMSMTSQPCHETDIDIDKDIDIEKEINKEKESKSKKHKHGRYDNVLLTDEDLQKLQEEFPTDWEQRIETLSEYMASTGKSYKSHLATIRNWARRDKETQKSSPKNQFNNFEQRDYDPGELIRRINHHES